MKLYRFEHRIKVRHRRWKEYPWGEVEWQEERTQSVLKLLYFIGIPIWWKIIYHEKVPSFAWIQLGALGYTDWKSELPEWAFKLKKI